MRLAAAWMGTAALWLCACLKFDPFACSDDTQCDLEGQEGQCQPTGFCAYTDLECASGLRYGDHADGNLGGRCVDENGETTALDDSTSDSTTGTGSQEAESSDSSTGAQSEDTCGGPGEPCCDEVCNEGLACAGRGCGCIAAIAAGEQHTCAVKLDGTVWCWGANDVGQVQYPASDDAVTTPTPVPDALGSANAVSISARSHTCVLRSDAVGVCWGANDFGQSDPTETANVAPPREATWATPSTVLAAGLTHTCAMDSRDSLLSCWGSNDRNQLGSTAQGPGPIQENTDLEFVRIELGDRHGCGLTASGELWCWGDNADGQLARDPTLTPTSATPRRITFPPIDDLAVGARHTCIRMDNDIRCWGRNAQGQLGDGTGMQSWTPTMVELPPGLAIVSIATGPNHTCAIEKAGGLWCWGTNDKGQLMLEPDPRGNDLFTLSPVELELGAHVQQFAGGGTHSCALVDTGEIWCWGTNDKGQIGDGSTNYAFEPTAVDLPCP